MSASTAIEQSDLSREAVTMCPACGDSSSSPYYSALTDITFRTTRGAWSAYECDSCGSLYLNPRPTRDAITRAYTNYFTHALPRKQGRGGGILQHLLAGIRNDYLIGAHDISFEPRLPGGRALAFLLPLLTRKWSYSARHLDGTCRKGRLLDIGCANGEYLSVAKAAGWDAIGVEPDGVAAKLASDSGHKVIAGRIEDVLPTLDSFDAITMSHVIEHLHDPVEVLRECRKHLRPGGLLWLSTPNRHAFTHALYGAAWPGLDSPRHLTVFSKNGLAACLQRAGFMDRETRPIGMKAAYRVRRAHAISRGSGLVEQYDYPLHVNLLAILVELLEAFWTYRQEDLVFLAR